MRIRLLFFVITLFLIGITKDTSAATYQWYGGTGNWNVSGNWYNSSTGSFTGYPGTAAGDIAYFNSFFTDNVTLTANLPFAISQVQAQAYSACNITINSGVTLNVTNGLQVTGTWGGSYDGIGFAGQGSAIIGGASVLTYYATITVGASNTVTFSAGSTITMSSNYCVVTNNGTLNLNGTSSSGITTTLAYYGTLNNQGTLNASYTTFALPQNNAVISNIKTFTATSSTFNLTGQQCSITNTGSVGNFTLNASTINMTIANNQINIVNSSSATFTAGNGSAINIGSYQGYINNSATFVAGSTGSPCIITITGQGNNSSPYSITNTGTFTVGPTSSINAKGTDSSNPIKINNVSGTFTLQSDATGSASVGALGAGSSFVGIFRVERYITGGSSAYRSYRIFSSPVNIATDSHGNKIYSLNYVQNYALVTGAAGGGFDKTGNPSLYLFREDLAISNVSYTSGNFWGVSKINNATAYNYYLNGGSTTYNIPVGNGFLFFFRGDRTTNLANKYTPGTSAESVTMVASGTLNQGSYTVHTWYNPGSSTLSYTTGIANVGVRGYVMVGNPYASPIDWETFQQTTSTTGIYGTSLMHNYFYALNPKTHNYGTYIKGNSGVGTNNVTNIIESGQGFFIADSCSCTTMIFNETAKTTSQATGLSLFMSTRAVATNANMQYLRLQLAEDTVNTDDMLLQFRSNISTAYKSNVDVPYKVGFGDVSLASMSSDHVPLAINVQPFPKTSESIGLTINATTDGIYSLNMKDLVSIPQLYDIWLMDAYKKDSLDMRHNKTYSFNVLKSDTNSFGSKRFSLVLRQNPAYAYHLLGFTATKVAVGNNSAMQVQLVWKTENEQNYTNFTVERSTDGGKTYDVIGSEQSSAQRTYSLLDKNPLVGQNLYRLKQEDINGSITYSNIVTILYANLGDNLVQNAINVYPNPAKGTINLTISADINSATTYNIQVTNSSGLLIKQATSAQPNWQASVSDLLPGTYIIKVLNNKDNTFIGNAKFVKL